MAHTKFDFKQPFRMKVKVIETAQRNRVDPLHFLADQRLQKFAQVILMEVLKSESVPRSSP